MRLKLALLSAAAALAMSAGAADAQTKAFRYAAQGDFLGLDPHINNEGPTNAMKGNLYEGLIYRDPDLKFHPSLATDWEQVDHTTWRFKLRQGVKFHGGQPFTADDVIFSYERNRQKDSEMSFTVASIKAMKKLDDFTIEVVTNGPDPILLQKLPAFYIMDKEWTEANNAQNVVRGAGVQTFANQNANGTGPFKLVERVADTRTVVEPNPNWWGKSQANFTRAVFTPIKNPATRVAALLSGEVDMIYPVPLQDVERIKNNPGTRMLQGPELRTIFFGFDQHRDELMDMPGSKKNPFKDVRVRKAFYQAIDINGIQRVVMRGGSQPTGSMIAPGIQGFVEEIHKGRYPYDPEASKKLLAEAGYANGFPVTLDCPNDRYINDEAICLAVVPMLKRVGIDVKLNAQNRSLHFDKIGQKQGNNTSFYMLGWTPSSLDAMDMIENIITLRGAGRGTWNSGRYTNPKVEDLADQIAIEMDQNKRNGLIKEALTIHHNDVGHIPLHQQTLAWAVRDTVADIRQRPTDDVDLRWVVMK